MTWNSYATSFQATDGLAHPFAPFCPLPHFRLYPSLKGVTTRQVIHQQLQRKHKETNSRKEAEGGRMCGVYITYTTPSGDSRGREWMNEAGMNDCIYILQNIKSWSPLKGNHKGFFFCIIPCDFTCKWLPWIKLKDALRERVQVDLWVDDYVFNNYDKLQFIDGKILMYIKTTRKWLYNM